MKMKITGVMVMGVLFGIFKKAACEIYSCSCVARIHGLFPVEFGRVVVGHMSHLLQAWMVLGLMTVIFFLVYSCTILILNQ